MRSAMRPTKERLSDLYTFCNRPRPVYSRPKYAEHPAPHEEGATGYGNIMYDRRVVRGNTYAQPIPQQPSADPADLQGPQDTKKRAAMGRKRARELRCRTPEAVQGRTHVDVQTEFYLEELSDHIEAADAYCQTDLFMDRPPSPHFIRAKTGKDEGTQIEGEELFDFDTEVESVLEVLVAKTLEQSLLEVMEEEELACLLAQQRSFRELRNAELAEVQRLEEQEHRLCDEKGRRIAQQREVLEKEQDVAKKAKMVVLTMPCLTNLLSTVYTTVGDDGHFFDHVEEALIHEVAQKRLDDFEKLDS
ncbi:hypothetical protein NHX12_025734 [Muraenolepis orangiensis]|uniref:Uncharacterized protein n=1 Tax=Muraenolepis orangiensis TaxID=630683 RepID=A0A9Q0EF77_9TELE|nr:hypothetical protein NHX12_025734 [Muraenolepis orangiensis]